MAIYPNSDEGRRRRSEFNDPRDAQAQGLTRYAEGPGATPNQKWNNTRAKVFDAALYPFAKLDRAMGGSGSMTPLQDDLRKERFAANDTALRAPRADVSNAQGSPAPGAAASDPKKPRTPEDINKIFENARLSMAKQAAGVGSVDLGAGNMGQRWEGQKYDQRLVDDMAGGGLKRNSLASSIGKFGEPVYDNASISRMLARDAGPGGWNVKNYSGAQEATRILQRRGSPSGPSGVAATGGGGVALPASSGGAGNRGAGGTGGQSGDSFGGYAGFRGQGGDPQARDIRGDLFGADSERKSAIENIDAAIKSLTTENGGLNMRSKRELLGRYVEQRNEIATMPYDVQNRRDVEGARLDAEMATRNADRGLDREKFSWDREKFGIDRQDRAAAAAAERNAPLSAKDKLDYDFKTEQLEQLRAGYRGVQDRTATAGINTRVQELMKEGLDSTTARRRAKQESALSVASTGQTIDTTPETEGAMSYLEDMSRDMSKERGWATPMWQGDLPGQDPIIDAATYPLDKIETRKRDAFGGVDKFAETFVPDFIYDAPDYEEVGPSIKGSDGKTMRYKRVLRDQAEADASAARRHDAQRLRSALPRS